MRLGSGSGRRLGFQNTGDLCQPVRGVFREGRHVGLRELLPTAELQDDDRNFGVVHFEPKNHRSPTECGAEKPTTIKLAPAITAPSSPIALSLPETDVT